MKKPKWLQKIINVIVFPYDAVLFALAAIILAFFMLIGRLDKENDEEEKEEERLWQEGTEGL